jgi:hypothetical protein
MKNQITTSKQKTFQWSLFIICLFTATFFSAQEQKAKCKHEKLWGGIGHISFSGEQLNLSDLNKSLEGSSYPSIPLNSTSFGGGGVFILNNVVVGGGGAWLMNQKTQNPLSSVNLKGGYGYFSLGYVVYSNKRSLLYPTLGIGGGGYTIMVDQKNSPKDFSQQLNSPNGMVALDAGGWMANFQLSYHYFFTGKDKEGFFIGLKAGYKYSPYNWTTSINDNRLNNSPKINMNGFYATLVLGGGNITH